jgi:putative Ig domain-containing protein
MKRNRLAMFKYLQQGFAHAAVLSGLCAWIFAGCDSKGASPTVVQLTPSSVQSLERGQTIVIAASVSNDPGNEGVAWSLAGAGTLVAETPSSVVYQAPTDTQTPKSAKVTASVKGQESKYATLSLWLAGPLSISTKTEALPHGSPGVRYEETRLQSSGGVGPYEWSVADGQLPKGLELSSNGIISGTPAGMGDFTFTVQVKDADNFKTTSQMRIVVSAMAVGARKKV